MCKNEVGQFDFFQGHDCRILVKNSVEEINEISSWKRLRHFLKNYNLRMEILQRLNADAFFRPRNDEI